MLKITYYSFFFPKLPLPIILDLFLYHLQFIINRGVIGDDIARIIGKGNLGKMVAGYSVAIIALFSLTN